MRRGRKLRNPALITPYVPVSFAVNVPWIYIHRKMLCLVQVSRTRLNRLEVTAGDGSKGSKNEMKASGIQGSQTWLCFAILERAQNAFTCAGRLSWFPAKLAGLGGKPCQ